MLQEIKKINVSGFEGSFPMNYTVEAVPKECTLDDGIEASSCISIENPVGVIVEAGIIEITVNFLDPSCMDCYDFKFTATDAKGCSASITFNYTNPCEEITLSAIFQGDFLQFYVIPTGGTPSYTYQWFWSAPYLEAIGNSQNEASLQLQLKPGEPFPPEPSFIISVTVTDQYGCVAYAITTMALCVPYLANITVDAFCTNEDGNLSRSETINIFPLIQECADCSVQVANTFFTVPNSVQYLLQNGLVYFYDIPEGIYQNGVLVIPFYVIDDCGRYSNTAFINILQPDCEDYTNCGINTFTDICEEVDCEDPEACLYFPLENWIFGPYEPCEDSIDWASVEILLEPMAPATLEYDAGNRRFIYCPNESTENVDIFQFTFMTVNGVQAPVVTVKITLGGLCPTPPSLTADDFEVCANSANNVFDVLANDAGPVNPLTLTIITPPTNGVANVAGGLIYYTPNPNYVGADSLVYQVLSPNGIPATATVTITVIAQGDAGISAVVYFCP